MAEFRLFSRNFIGCCLSSFFYFGAFYLFMPVLALFVEGLGGMATEIGLAVGIFTLLSVVVRPYSGKLGDRYGLKRFMMLGAGLFALFFLGYYWITDLTVLYVLRVLHGIAHGIFLAAVFAYVGSLAPPNRRGEVMGVFGVANVIAMAIFPAVGTYMVQSLGGFDELFLAASVMDCVAVASLLAVDEKRICVKAVASVSLVSVMRLRPVWLAFVTYTAGATAYGAIVTFLPVYAVDIGIREFGQFFIVYAAFTLVSRLVAGRVSDKFGRYAVVVPFLGMVGVSMVLFAMMSSLTMLWVSAALFGFGFGAFMPALNAYIIDETRPAERSSALAIFSSAMDVGITAGAVVLGMISEVTGYAFMYGISAVLAFGGMALFGIFGRKRSPIG